MRDLSLRVRQSHGHEEFGYKLWDPVNKKIIRSRDVVFLEDQVGEDVEKAENSNPSTSTSIDLTPVHSPPVHPDYGEGVQEDHGDNGNENNQADEEVEPAEQVEEEQQAPVVESQLRISTREC